MTQHQDVDFAAALRSVARLSFFQNTRLRLSRTEKGRSRLEQNRALLSRARGFLPESVIEQAMQHCHLAADYALSIENPAKQISVAFLGTIRVRASENPFQEEDLYYLSPSKLVPQKTTSSHHKPREPHWNQQGEVQTPVVDTIAFTPPRDLTRLPVLDFTDPQPEGFSPRLTLPPGLFADALARLDDLLTSGIQTIPCKNRKRIPIGEALMNCGFGEVTTHELTDPRLDIRLLASGRITEEEFALANAHARNLKYLNLAQTPPHPLVSRFDEAQARSQRIADHHTDASGTVHLITDRPGRARLIDEAVKERFTYELHIVTRSALEQLFDQRYPAATPFRSTMNLDHDAEAPGRP